MNTEQRRCRQTDYLKHMLDAARLALAHTDGMNKTDFLKDKRTQQAVILNILIIGEAATKLADEYPELVTRHAEVPWRAMRGMRNRMAHGYFDINLDIVWDTIRQSVPKLEQQILEILHTQEVP
jgi:uncharacterized protein with HEPN domain